MRSILVPIRVNELLVRPLQNCAYEKDGTHPVLRLLRTIKAAQGRSAVSTAISFPYTSRNTFQYVFGQCWMMFLKTVKNHVVAFWVMIVCSSPVDGYHRFGGAGWDPPARVTWCRITTDSNDTNAASSSCVLTILKQLRNWKYGLRRKWCLPSLQS